LRYYEGTKLRYENVGENAKTAVTKLEAKEKLLAAKTAAKNVGIELPEVPGRKYLRKEALRYIGDRKNAGAKEAARQAENVTEEFIGSSGRTFVDEVTKDDVFAYYAWLRKQGQADRTVANKDQRLRSFLRFAGVDVKTIMPPKPKYEKTLPTTYTEEEVNALLGAADPYMTLVIELGLKCGLRELEMVYLEWPDIHWHDKVLRVQGKPSRGFKVKDSEQRDVPIPDDLLEHLKAWHETHKNTRLVVGTKKDNPNMHMLRQLKRLVNRAGLACGVCDTCKSEIQECKEWTLHKLRRTYATTLLRSGLDIKTVQSFMGHADLATITRYLRPAGSRETQATVTSIFASMSSPKPKGKTKGKKA
jgi:integrase